MEGILLIKEARGYGLTIDEARENAIANLNAAENEDIQFEVIATPKKKTFGLFGGSKAEVRVFVELPDEKPKKVNKKNNVGKNDTTKKEKVKVEKEAPKQKEAVQKVDASELKADTNVAKAVEYLKGILDNLGCKNISIKVSSTENSAEIDLDGKGLGVIIGHRGETLDALQYLTSLAANNGGGNFKVKLNIGDYREKREQTLIALAKRISEQVKATGKSRRLEPMNPYERRIIHTTVQEIEGVVSVSFGEGNARRVVIALEGEEIRMPRQSSNRRDNRSRRPRPQKAVAQAPAREPKKDTDIPLYGKIN